MSRPRLVVRAEHFALRETFVISRGAKTHAEVIVVELRDEAGNVGRGEAVPYTRYGESIAGTMAIIEDYSGPLLRNAIEDALPPGAARNALDCALWDLDAKQSGVPACQSAGVAQMRAVATAYTLSLATPEAMAAKALTVPHLELLKLKLGGQGDAQRMAAVRAARPDATLIADANEAWTDALLEPLMAAAADACVALIEQPLPAGADAALADITRTVPVCADESAHTTRDITALADRYDAVNIKLDKTGGLTEALRMHHAARSAGLKIMVGSMVASSLAIAPALILAQDAEWADLDGPLLLAVDRAEGVRIENGLIQPPQPALWG